MWYHNNKIIYSIEDLPENAHGIIYKISRIDDGKFYIGKKNLYSERNVKMGKKEAAKITDKRRKLTKKVKKESDWKSYYGSEDILKRDVKELGEEMFKREIIHVCFNKKSLTYQELRHQFLNGCLESDNCFNGNIAGKFFRKDIN